MNSVRIVSVWTIILIMCIQAIDTRVTSRGSNSVKGKYDRRININNLVSVSPIESVITSIYDFRHNLDRHKCDNRSRVLINIPLINDHKKSTFGLLNARSINGKTDRIKDLIFDHKIDVLSLTETWLCDSSNYVASDVTPPGFVFFFKI